MKPKIKSFTVLVVLILALGACTMIVPFAWMIVTSLKQ